MNFTDYLASKFSLINNALETSVPSTMQPVAIHEAMRYSLLAGGKRLRALLALMVVEVYGRSIDDAIPVGCALEMIHTYSLIHDDLPCMDDDDLRRGKPTNHKVYGEAMALLAGDALLTMAFGQLAQGCANGHYSADTLARLLTLLTEASGSTGMIGGQVIDMTGLGDKPTLADLDNLHRLKTGALIKASVVMGAVVAKVSSDELDSWAQFGSALGLAFQIQDDILDLTGDEVKMGKKIGRDEKNNKVTYVTLLGLEGARSALQREHQRALSLLDELSIDTNALRQLVVYLITREN